MKVLVPTSWSEVSVMEFQQLSSLDLDDSPAKGLNNIISILCGIDDSLQLDRGTAIEIENTLSFLSKGMTKDRYSSFTYKGVEYEWIKSLNEITLGEQISIEQTIETEELNYTESFDLVMAVLLVKKGETFDVKNLKRNRELYSTFPIDKVHGMILFFLNGGNLSSNPMKEFLVVHKTSPRETTGQMKRDSLMRRLKKRIYLMALSGLQWLTGWLRMTLRSMS